MSNPFSSSSSHPGDGSIHLALLPPNTPRLRTIQYQYPLKLVTPAASRTEEEPSQVVHTVYLLTYGGGLVAGDCINLHVRIESTTRLILLTQGTTKLFKSPSRDVVSRQAMTVTLDPGSALCYLPDPVQPFEHSCFEQRQVYKFPLPEAMEVQSGSLCALDWVCNGRPANGEDWSCYHYQSCNEVYLSQSGGQQKLLLRDNLTLDDGTLGGNISKRMNGLGVYATLILYGPMLTTLGQFFMDEFKHLPRIGGRKWDSGSESGEDEVEPAAIKRAGRHRYESAHRILWSAAALRGCVVVKFGAPDVESGRRWIWTMLTEEKSVVTHFGEQCLLCLR